MKTAEEILNEEFKDSIPSEFEGKIWDDRVIKAMQKYSNQQNAELIKENERLRKALIAIDEEIPKPKLPVTIAIKEIINQSIKNNHGK